MSSASKETAQPDATLIENILEQIPTPVMAVNLDMQVIYMNAAGRNFLGRDKGAILGNCCADLFMSEHCRTDECRIRKAIETGESYWARNTVKKDGKPIPIELCAVPLKDETGKVIGGLEYIIDITERVRDEERIREQSQTIRAISTPAIKLWDGMVILPVVGVVDSMRAQQMMDVMLAKIVETAARVIILDIQGVAALDTAVANHLMKISRATHLMGCQCIISGISPAVAQTIVHLGIDMSAIHTNSTLSDALAEAFRIMDVEVVKTDHRERTRP
ncbi:PAS domain-containing protein [bacterium]|nr:PAS domain-containing protein [bacterium]